MSQAEAARLRAAFKAVATRHGLWPTIQYSTLVAGTMLIARRNREWADVRGYPQLTTEETQRLWLRLEAEHQTQLEIVQDQPSIQLITGVQDVINLGAMRT
jgi:hypothetical protein